MEYRPNQGAHRCVDYFGSQLLLVLVCADASPVGRCVRLEPQFTALQPIQFWVRGSGHRRTHHVHLVVDLGHPLHVGRLHHPSIGRPLVRSITFRRGAAKLHLLQRRRQECDQVAPRQHSALFAVDCACQSLQVHTVSTQGIQNDSNQKFFQKQIESVLDCKCTGAFLRQFQAFIHFYDNQVVRVDTDSYMIIYLSSQNFATSSAELVVLVDEHQTLYQQIRTTIICMGRQTW